MAVLAIVVAASLITLADDSRAEPTPWELPRWEEGFTWSYEVDQDVDMDLLGFVQVDHIHWIVWFISSEGTTKVL